MYNESENQFEPNTNTKLMFDLISPERKAEIHRYITETVAKFRNSGKLEFNRWYPIELTRAFDKEEPKQFVYIKCIFKVEEMMFGDIADKVVGELPPEFNKEMPLHNVKLMLECVEVFNEENVFNWLDHVEKLEKQSVDNKEKQLFYENNIYGQRKLNVVDKTYDLKKIYDLTTELWNEVADKEMRKKGYDLISSYATDENSNPDYCMLMGVIEALRQVSNKIK